MAPTAAQQPDLLPTAGEIGQLQRVADDNAPQVNPPDMLRHLANDNRYLARAMRELHERCDAIQDLATASILENYIDEAEGRTWFLAETARPEDPQGAILAGA